MNTLEPKLSTVILNNGEKAIISKQAYIKNEMIHILSGDILCSRSRETIEIENNKHLFDHFCQYLNHSFNPNIKIINKTLIALKNISAGDELRFDYTQTESAIANPFTCHETGLEVNTFACQKRRV